MAETNNFRSVNYYLSHHIYDNICVPLSWTLEDLTEVLSNISTAKLNTQIERIRNIKDSVEPICSEASKNWDNKPLNWEQLSPMLDSELLDLAKRGYARIQQFKQELDNEIPKLMAQISSTPIENDVEVQECVEILQEIRESPKIEKTIYELSEAIKRLTR